MTELPGGWRLASLSELGTWTGGGTPSKGTVAFWNGDIPWVSPKDMKVMRIRDTEDHITDAAVAGSSTCLVPRGAVLVVTRSGILRHTFPVAVADRKVAINQDLKALLPHPGLVPEYVAWSLRAHAPRILSSCSKSGTTVQSIETTKLLDFAIPIAPASEQRRIVEAIEEQFSRLDNAEKLLGRVLRSLEVLRAHVLATAFVGDWPWTTIGEIADIVGGVTKDAKRQSDPSFVEVPYLRVANVQRGSLDLTTVTTIRVPPEKARALELRVGDVLFNEGGDRDKLGRGWIWSGEIEGCIHQNHVFRARLRDDFEPKFVSLHGNIFGRRWFEERGRQTTNLASLNLKTLKSFPVPAPLLDEQREIVSELERRLSLIDALANEVRQAMSRSAALRRSILECAFTGKLAPQDPSDEPASMLLERIAARRIPARKPSRSRRKVPA